MTPCTSLPCRVAPSEGAVSLLSLCAHVVGALPMWTVCYCCVILSNYSAHIVALLYSASAVVAIYLHRGVSVTTLTVLLPFEMFPCVRSHVLPCGTVYCPAMSLMEIDIINHP
jgi:hypothetical protein